jgi:hypothetical protein
MGLEPMQLMPQTSILPVKLFPQINRKKYKEPRGGIEPPLFDLQSNTLPFMLPKLCKK